MQLLIIMDDINYMQKKMRQSLEREAKIIISLDVEEEGLFSGQYARTGCSLKNVSLLPRLAAITRDLGFPLTLFCTYNVLADPASRDILAFMRDDLKSEIGAHLHHWSTPPLGASNGQGGGGMVDGPGSSGGSNASDYLTAPERTDKISQDLLRARLRSLLDLGRDFLGRPMTGFRMGRWDLKAKVRPMLAEEGILVDSSVAPLRFFKDGADHFLAPADPYWVDCGGGRRLLEAPITQISLFPFLPKSWHRLGHLLPETWQPGFIDSFRGFSSLSANPLWHGGLIMKLAAKLHFARGGRILSLFWHSSEMMPGGSPHIPDQKAADELLRKITIYLQWLKDSFNVRGQTLSELYSDPVGFPERPLGEGDW